jgi:hypothetical protein
MRRSVRLVTLCRTLSLCLATSIATPALTASALAAPAPSHAAHPAPARAEHPGPRPDAPKPLGTYDDWQVATHSEAGQMVCYAFTRAQTGAAASPAASRNEPVLTVTQRPASRDAVAISAGYAYPANAEVAVQIDQTSMSFYTAQRSAFARDGHEAVAAFQKGRQAVAKGPGPRNAPVTDTFSLRGFSAAYAAINKACPPK